MIEMTHDISNISLSHILNGFIIQPLQSSECVFYFFLFGKKTNSFVSTGLFLPLYMFKTAGSFTPAAPVQSMPQKAGTVKAADFDRETSAPFRRGE